MKKNIYIIIFILPIALIVLGSMNNPVTAPTTNEPIVQEPVKEIPELCYIWNTEAGDSAALRMKIADGTNVTGSFNYFPFEKDRRTGTIVGTAGPVDPMAMARTAKLMWTVTGEGMTNQEELFVSFGEGMAYPGFGEMKDRGDGTYVYADQTKISYNPPMQQTDCGDPVAQ